MSATDTILMVRPASFAYNSETAVNNYFQSIPEEDNPVLQGSALAEFDQMAQVLRDNGVEVIIIEDSKDPPKPDAIFPNNWLSTSPGGKIHVFPMFARSRRTEKRNDIIDYLASQFVVNDVQDWSRFEAEGRFLEGTGSMVIDHDHQMIYACISERTNLSVLEKFAAANGYQAIVFLATDKSGFPIYHTNVVMSLGDGFCILCEEAIEEEWELIAVRQLLESTGHVIVPITREQMHCFAGNMLLLKTKQKENILVMSRTAHGSLTKEQRSMLEAFAKAVVISVPTIEKVEGGSVRCMIAEIFLEKRAPQTESANT